ncbi:cap-specific mRNA (nucleoside-2'-O-)-methyltransferase 1-like isoform X1 [Bacillus rossius redtenbacheri]|uniref:cap-specific mRNA (nucleoside-2'-O-)-methyltransferase 1-like isoform X1 n=1 Tax=Bacillus rossius redtenbacheri TaxID=93214 RepID=UPI002FDDDB47
MAESKSSEGDKRKVKSEANDESLHSSRVFTVEGLRSANLSDSSVDGSSDDDDDVPSEPPPSRKRAHSDSSSHDDAEAYGTVAKKFVRYANDMEPNFGENKAQKMMAKMGYKSGHGLGKHEQGRVAPIELSLQRGRRGLGLHLPGLEPANLVWNSEMEHISHEEEVAWFTHDPYEDVTYEDMCKWPVIGRKKLTIDDETNFCDPGVLKNVLSEKNVFDNLDGYELRKARSRSNPFETIRGGMFLNRAAMKMANMDRVFDNMFTKPVDEYGQSLVEPGELLYFADVCAGPGGFSEYVLWRCGWEAKGFGFTLKGENDFKLSDFYAGNCETFEPHYGVGGAEGDGDIFKPDNIDAFTKHVMSQTDGRGVHFMMADGGFSVEGQENIQEILSKELYLCQFIVALCIVREKGHFVCKLFDLFTPFSVGLVYLISKAFQRISIHKPNTSRPANSERYVICQWRRHDFQLEPVREYLRYIHGKLHECQQQKDKDVVEIVPLSLLTEEGKFFDYMVTSNNVLGERQIVNLVKISSFCRDPNLMEPLQTDMKQKCLQYWDVPDKARTIPPRISPETKFTELLGSTKTSESVLGSGEEELTPGNLLAVLGSGFDWHCMVLGTRDEGRHRTLYLGMGRGKVFRLDGPRWRKVEESIELSPDTLLYAEMVAELLGEGRSQRKVMCLHIIDALVLGGRHIGQHHLTERHALCQKFCRALNKPLRTPATHVRTKELFDLEAAEQMFARLDARILKGCGQISRRVFLVDDGHRCYVPGGVLFLNATRPPWLRFLSKSTGFKYYNNPITKTSLFDRQRPDDACASFETSVKHRRVWWWGAGVHVHSVDAQEEDKDRLQGRQLLDFVNSMYLQQRAK